ncbi:MAG: extracellular solute-binding protein [Alphaproteobacteria bacterium]|nr:extracellular solute-binding protein [Alphaproteobacteria bacterium]
MKTSGFGRWMTIASLLGALVLGATDASAQKKLVVYSANDSTLNDLVFNDFNKQTGITVEPVAAGSGVLMRRLQSEKARPQADIVWGVSRSLLQTNSNVFEAYSSKNKDVTPPEYRDPKDLWIGNNLHLLVILQNTKLVPEGQGPKSWEDLLDPKWKGKIAFTDPANSGSAYQTVTMLVDMWGGGDAGWKKVGQLLRNMKVLNRSSLVFQGVGNGEYPLGISLEYAGPLWAKGGAPVRAIYPADGTTASMEGVAIIKGGPNTENARKFVDFINTKETREFILRSTFRRPTRSDVDLGKLPGGMPSISAIKLVNYDEEGWTEKRGKTLEKIKDLIQDSR